MRCVLPACQSPWVLKVSPNGTALSSARSRLGLAQLSYNDGQATLFAYAREKAMIRPRRIGHATFETPDLDKAIAYYEKFVGLIVAEREKDRAFLATKIGQLVIALSR